MSYEVNANSSVYYGNTYWNDIAPVRDEINRRISGDPGREWFHRFQELVGGRRFRRALMLNCGNGHVERALFDIGLIEECVGIDYSEELLAQARKDNAHLAVTYHQMDTNTARFPDGPFDLVVNFAAAHHIARIDKVFRALCELLPEDGWFVSYDYVGPHRNQYGYDLWDAAHAVNETLPAHVRQEMRYPHLPTMLATDPTEAIHSELVLETFERYFDVVDRRDTGGAIAYLLLTHNQRLFELSEAERDAVATRVMELDGEHLAAHPDEVLFSYFAGQPRKGVLQETERLALWTKEEDERETLASANGGEYYPRTALQHVHLELEDQRMKYDAGREEELATVRAEIAMIRSTFPFPLWERVKNGGRALARRNPTFGRYARAALRRARGPVGPSGP